MPPHAKITKPMLLNAALRITRRAGFDAVNARSIAAELQCSTRPLFTCYRNMEELKADFLDFAFAFYTRYVDAYATDAPGYLILPLSYVDFAREETHLFRLLFVTDMALSMTKPQDFYREPGNAAKADAFAAALGIGPERARAVFFDLFLYAHGLAVLTAAGKVAFSRADAEVMLANLLDAMVLRAAGPQAP